MSELLRAVYRGDAAEVDRLRAAADDLTIFEAAAVGDVGSVRNWVTHEHAPINEFSDDGFTPLHLAAYFGHREAARLLLENGADFEAVATNEMEVRPLHSAAAAADTSVAFLLIDRGADVNARQHAGWTPLHAAAANGDVELVTALLSAGAEPDSVNDAGVTPADLARKAGHTEVLTALN